jgi:hypothetical protein
LALAEFVNLYETIQFGGWRQNFGEGVTCWWTVGLLSFVFAQVKDMFCKRKGAPLFAERLICKFEMLRFC